MFTQRRVLWLGWPSLFVVLTGCGPERASPRRTAAAAGHRLSARAARGRGPRQVRRTHRGREDQWDCLRVAAN